MEPDDKFVKDLADELAGNFSKFTSFAMDREYREAMVPVEDWCVVYTHNRDSGLAEMSNAEAIKEIMKPFCGYVADGDDCDDVRHGHWGPGWVEGYCLRIRKDGVFTPAFLAWAEIQNRLEDYPLLDEEDFSEREYEATMENVADVTSTVANRYDIPPVSTEEVYEWLSTHECSELESSDGNGGWPSEESVTRALRYMGYIVDDTEE